MNLVLTSGNDEAQVALGKSSNTVVLIVHCTRAPSQGVEWGQNPTHFLSGRRLRWPGQRDASSNAHTDTDPSPSPAHM